MQPSSPQLKNKFLTLLLPLIMALVICAGSVPDVLASIAHAPAPLEKEALLRVKNRVAFVYHNDPNGLPQELTKPNGEIVWSATYDAMGRVDQILVDEVAQPLRMQGQYWDDEIALCYNRHRYFDPQICSFISQDPLGLAAGENVYAYAPNVWGWADPLGLCKESRPATGSTGNTINIASDFIGNKREIGKSPLANLFYSVPNKAGGRVFVSTDEIDQLDFLRLVNTKNAKSKVTVLTGTHGDPDGNLIPELNFFNEDIDKWGSRKKIDVIDITKMSDMQISQAINSSDRVVCAWCFSERSSTVLKALGFI
jgi:RHS repeat-associated protein